MIVRVEEHSTQWDRMYREEAEIISRVLGELLCEIHHIGSTAVDGLAAKPIIDIMPVVTDIRAVDDKKCAFEDIGYEYMGEFGIPGRRYLRKGGDMRTHQIHIFESGNIADIERHLAVRDYLRAHENASREYGALKKRLAALFPDDIEGYCDGKDKFVKELEERALMWFHGDRM